MNKRVVLFPGNFDPEYVDRIVDESNIECPVVIVPESMKAKWQHENKKTEVFSLQSLAKEILFDFDLLSNSTSLKELFDNVFDDSRTYYLIERLFTFSKENSVFNRSADVYVLLLNIVFLIKKTPAAQICFPINTTFSCMVYGQMC